MTIFLTRENAMRKALKVVQNKRHPCVNVTIKAHAKVAQRHRPCHGSRVAYTKPAFSRGFTVQMFSRRGYNLGMM